MKAAAIIVNFFFPGVGTLILGRIGTGVTQLILYILGIMLTITAIGSIIGVPLMIGVWIWGLVSAASAPSAPVVVNVVGQSPQPPQS